MIDQLVRQRQATHLHPAVQMAGIRQILQNMGGKTARAVFLDNQQPVMVPCQPVNQIGIHGLGKTRIGNGDGPYRVGQTVCRRDGIGKACTKRQDGDTGTIPDHAPAPDRHRRAHVRKIRPDALAPRIAQG